MSVANVFHSASMTHIHSCIILLLIVIHSMHIGKMFPATVATVKCPSGRNNCGNSYNSLTFNRRISLYTTTQYTKSEEMFLSVLEKYFLTPFPLVLRSFCLLRKI